MFTKKKCIVVLLSVFALYLYGCGDGHVIPTSEQNVSGKLAQGYVHGATTWADKLTTATTGNFTIDTGEESTVVTSNVDGSYSMTIPANYGDYVIVSKGGFVEDSEGARQPAATMMAPAPDAGEGTITVNVTPVTTLVALKPDLADKIVNYGADIAATSGADAGLVQLAKTVESILSLLTDSKTGVVDKDNLASQMEVIAEVADKISDSVESASALDAFLEKAIFADVIEEAVESGLTTIRNKDEFRDDVIVSDLSTVVTIIGTAVETVSTAIQDASSGGTVTESSVLTAVETAVDTAETAIDAVVASVSVTIGTPFFPTTATISAIFSPVNDIGRTKTYPGASLEVTINDNPATTRILVIEITDLAVSIDTSNSITIAATASSKVLITGQNKSGTTKVDMSLSGAGSYFDMSGNTMTLYMGNVKSALTTAYPNSVLLNINEPGGKYIIDIGSSGFPLDAKSANIPES